MRRILGVVAVCVAGASAWGQQVVPAVGPVDPGSGSVADGNIVYDNSTNLLGSLIEGIDIEVGDGCTLAGTDRVVTNISLLIHANGGDATADVQVRLYEFGELASPKRELWNSITLPQVTITSGTQPYDWPVPYVTVPDTITWTVELTNVTPGTPGANVGSRFVSPPTVGSSRDWVWERFPNGTWNQRVFNIGAGNNNFGATITAIAKAPCPSCACVFDPIPTCNIFDFLAFQNLFVIGDPCACNLDPDPACNIFDFLEFQNQFVGGCP